MSLSGFKANYKKVILYSLKYVMNRGQDAIRIFFILREATCVELCMQPIRLECGTDRAFIVYKDSEHFSL